MIEIENIKNNARKTLSNLEKFISDADIKYYANFNITINSDINEIPNDILNKIKGIKPPIIYIIEIDKKRSNKLLDDFVHYKRGKDSPKFSRRNEEHQYSNIIYVGSSTTDFTTRLKNHIGITGKQVYSLHLKEWIREEHEIQLKIYQIFSNEPIERSKVEFIEQHFWDKLKPLFGKRSGLL